MKKIELLAPAGSFEAMVAAINAGCDAIYLSGYMFGARKFAPNFSNEDIKKAIEICHTYGVKVYITVNTLIKENEVDMFLEYIDFLHKNNVDAVIIQDLGMIDLIHQTYPNLEIHASTQMHIHNFDGIKLCEELGIKRVVLARESSIDLIKEIKENTNIELEVFVHGALCVSYSGQCLMSSLIGGRSGNRGACAGTCRLPYKLVDNENNRLNKNDYVLSMKDLCTLENIDKLIESGVDSFKIEGRMKRPEYVFLVTSLYRKAIDSYCTTGKVIIDDNDLMELKKIFNRQFTKGFLFNEENNNITNDYRPNHLGVNIGTVLASNSKYITIKLTEDLNIGDGIRVVDSDVGSTITSILKNNNKITSAKCGDVVSIKLNGNIKPGGNIVKTTDINQLKGLKNKITSIYKKIGIDASLTLRLNQTMVLELNDGINSIKVKYGKVEQAVNAPLSNEDIKKQMSKLGNTPFVLDNIVIDKDENIFINNKDLNILRRLGIEKLIQNRLYSTNYKKMEYKRAVPEFKQKQEINILLEDSNLYYYIKELNINNIYTDDVKLIENTKDERLILKLSRVIEKYTKYNYPLLVGELGGVKQENALVTDFSLNVMNSYTVAFLHRLGIKKITLSYELEYEEIKQIINNYKLRYNNHPNLEVIVYGREEMMISRFSLNKLYNRNNLYLIDRYNKRYPIKEKDNLMYIYNSNIRNDKNDYYKIGVNSIRVNLFDTNDIKNLLIFLK